MQADDSGENYGPPGTGVSSQVHSSFLSLGLKPNPIVTIATFLEITCIG